MAYPLTARAAFRLRFPFFRRGNKRRDGGSRDASLR